MNSPPPVAYVGTVFLAAAVAPATWSCFASWRAMPPSVKTLLDKDFENGNVFGDELGAMAERVL